jgi:hypothetical protein
MPHRAVPRFVLVLVLVTAAAAAHAFRVDTLPDSLSDRDFWALSRQLSEPDGHFVSRSGSPDNLLSNELQVSTVAAALVDRVRPAGVYLGVGPEQNFSYIAATTPRIAFITDIRRGNLDLHLLYKAIFELSADRSAFVARLFSRRMTPVEPAASADRLMRACLEAPPLDDAAFEVNLRAVVDGLTRGHAFDLGPDDRRNLEAAYRAFHRFGPAIDYTSSIGGSLGRFNSYAAIAASVDRLTGHERSFLANDAAFAAVKAMERRNLIVPVVGDFAGPKALRAIGTWLRAHDATVSAFYVSNVEQYLQQNGVWPAFCANAAALPVDAASVFIRPGRGGVPFSPIAAETTRCAATR